MRSSIRLYKWLTANRVLGLYIRGYTEYRAITLASKISSISLMWIVMGSTIIFVIDILWLQIFLVLIALTVTIFLLSIKTLTKESLAELKKSFELTGEVFDKQ